MPEGSFIQVDYDSNGRVKSLKGPHPSSGMPYVISSFRYDKGYTEVSNAMGLNTRYRFDEKMQLTAIEKYNLKGKIHKIEKKYWGKSKANAGLLLAKTLSDGEGCIHTYRTFNYDNHYNIIEERLYGNLTGKEEVSLQVNDEGHLKNANEEECHIISKKYSLDDFNLLLEVGDCKSNKITYSYKEGTNLLSQQFTYDRDRIKKRLFNFYNADAVCIKTIEDDGGDIKENKIWGLTERQIIEIVPKDTLPNVGLPEIIEKKALENRKNNEIILKKFINKFDTQGNLIVCETYGSDGVSAFVESKVYNNLGLVIDEIDRIGNHTQFTYDALGRNIAKSFLDKEIHNQFDFCGNIIDVTETTTCSSRKQLYEYDFLGRKICSTDFFGAKTDFTYDEFGRLIKVTHPEVVNENEQLVRPTFMYTYDILDYPTSVTDPKGYTTKKTYNIRGSPTKILYPDGSSELFKYDPEGSLHRSLTRNQILTVYEYDYLGRPIYAETSTVNEKGVYSFYGKKSWEYTGFRCRLEKQNDIVADYQFDSFGRPVSISQNYNSFQNEKSPRSRIIELQYDSFGRINKRKIFSGTEPNEYSVECYEYDLLGNVTEKRIEDSEKNILLRRGYVFDANGKCIEEIGCNKEGHFSILKTVYDEYGEPILFQDSLNNETKIIFDPFANNTSVQKSIKKVLVNHLGIKTEIEFDLLGRIISIVKKDNTDELLSSKKIYYDSVGNKTSEKHDQVLNGKIIGTQVSKWTYGPMGRLETEEISSGNKKIYTYNDLGQIISLTDSESLTPISYTYNREGKIISIESKDNIIKQNNYSCKYSYDKHGNIVFASSSNGISIDRQYNAFNQILKETVENKYNKTYAIEYSYDRKGRLTSLTLPDGSKIAYVYDSTFGKKVHRISSNGEVCYTHTYNSYDLQGNLTEESSIGYTGLRKHTYDLFGRKAELHTDISSETYTRDSLGRITDVQIEQDSNTKYYQFSYNGLSQLALENRTEEKRLVYDSLDNCHKVNNDNYIYQGFQQLISSGDTQFQFDFQGNVITEISQKNQTQFSYNRINQLISIKKDEQTITCDYDPFGRLQVLRKNTDSEKKNAIRFLYIGDQEIGTINERNEIETLKIPGLLGDKLSDQSIAIEIEDQVYLPLHDFTGSVSRLIDPQTRNTIERYEYSTFGEERIFNEFDEQIEASKNPWRFAEKRKITGLVYFGNRFYNPLMGRWMSQDPIGMEDGPNLYAYLHGNSINYNDRFGLASENNLQNQFEEYFYGEVETHCYCERHRTCKRGGDIGRKTSLPKISYVHSFEQYYAIPRSGVDFWASDLMQPYFEPSRIYDLGLPELSEGAIGFINGIDNSFSEAENSAKYISRLAGGTNVHFVHNASHRFDVDLLECGLGLKFIATEPVKQLHAMWNSFFERASVNALFLMICHSQGAIHTRNALLDYPKELRDRILVIAIAPGGYIYRRSCAQVSHYRAKPWRDFVPYLDRAGAKREKDTIIDLNSHEHASFFDHTFTSLTYQDKLQQDILDYIQGKR